MERRSGVLVASVVGLLVMSGCGTGDTETDGPAGTVATSEIAAPDSGGVGVVDPVAAVAARAAACTEIREFEPLEETLAAIDDWAEIVEAPADLDGARDGNQPGGLVVEFQVRSHGRDDVYAEQYRVTDLWTPETSAAANDPSIRVWVGRGSLPFAPESEPRMIFVMVTDGQSLVLSGPCRTDLTAALLEPFGDDAVDEVIALTELDGPLAAARYRSALAAFAGDAHPEAFPQHLPGMSERPELASAETVERSIRVVLEGKPQNESIVVCAATAEYVGLCAELGAFGPTADGNDFEFTLTVDTLPGVDVRVVYSPAGGSSADYLDLAKIGREFPAAETAEILIDEVDGRLIVAESHG